MKKKNIIIIISVSVVLVTSLIVTAILLTKNTSGKTNFNTTVVDISAKKEKIEPYIINWDSSTKEHDTMHLQNDTVCAISVEPASESSSFYFYQEYNNFQEAWSYAQSA